MWFSQHQLFSTLSGWGLSPKFFQIIQAALSITHWVLKLLFCHNNLLTVGALSCCLWQTPPNGTMQKKKKKNASAQAFWNRSVQRSTSWQVVGSSITFWSIPHKSFIHLICHAASGSTLKNIFIINLVLAATECHAVSSSLAYVLQNYKTPPLDASVLLSSLWHNSGRHLWICAVRQLLKTVTQTHSQSHVRVKYETSIFRVAECVCVACQGGTLVKQAVLNLTHYIRFYRMKVAQFIHSLAKMHIIFKLTSAGFSIIKQMTIQVSCLGMCAHFFVLPKCPFCWKHLSSAFSSRTKAEKTKEFLFVHILCHAALVLFPATWAHRTRSRAIYTHKSKSFH